MMMYSWVEMARALWAKPIAALSQSGAVAWGGLSPWGALPLAPEAAAWFELAGRLSKEYVKPEWRVESSELGGRSVAVSIQTIQSRPFGALIRFVKEGPEQASQPKLLIVAPMSGHYPTLLRDTVETLLPDNDVYMTEWVNPRDVPVSAGEFSLDDYVEHLIDWFKELSAQKDGRALHVMSVCQPTVPALGAVSLMSQRKDADAPQSMVMIGGPIDARKSPTATNNFALEHDIGWFERHLISMVPWPRAGAGRLVYPGFLQHMGFVAMNPSKHAKAHRDFFESLSRGRSDDAQKHREFYDEYNAVMDLPKAYYLQTVESVFQRFDLARGLWDVRGERVNPGEIQKTALMTLEGELDDISGAGQTHSAQELCHAIPEDLRERWTAPGVGHYGVFSGSKFKALVAPRINAFIERREQSWKSA